MIRASSPGITRISFLGIWKVMSWLALNSKPKDFMTYRNNWVQIMMKMMKISTTIAKGMKMRNSNLPTK